MVGPKGNFAVAAASSQVETFNLQCELSVDKSVTELCNLLGSLLASSICIQYCND